MIQIRQLDPTRSFSQNQAILTIIQSKIDTPDITMFRWLDLACGKGQLISQLESNYNEQLRKKIIYHGYDVDRESITKANQIARNLKFHDFKFDIGEIEKFDDIVEKGIEYDFITLINSIHEFSPKLLAEILYYMVLRLKTSGCLFIYDMKKLPKKELGSLTWTKEEFSEILNVFLDSIKNDGYHPFIGQWHHSSCTAWNVFIQKQYIYCTQAKLLEKKEQVIEAVNQKTMELIERKYQTCKKTLETYTECGADNQDEEKSLVDSLYDFWSLNKIKEVQE